MIMQLPPPKHGASFAGERIKNSKRINETFECDFLRISTVPLNGGGLIQKLRTMVGLYWKVWKLVSRRDHDLVYISPCASGLPFYKDWLVAAIARRYATRMVYHYHNKGVSVNRFVPRFIKRRFFAGVSVILLSPRLYYDVQDFVVPGNVHYLPYGVDRQANLNRPDGTPGTINILYLANMIRTKGVFVLLDACRILKGRGIEFQCRFAGPWYEIRESEFQEFVHAHKLEDIVVHVGPKYGAEKDAEFLRADVFAFPTFYPDECLPFVLLEAMSFGLPVVSTDEGAIADIIDDGMNGKIVEKQKAESLATALESLINDPTLRAQMGERALGKFTEKYTIEAFENGFIDIMHKLAARTPNL